MKTIGFTSRKPGSGSAAGRAASVTVSPMRTSARDLMPAITMPTSPTDERVDRSRMRVDDVELVHLVLVAHRP